MRAVFIFSLLAMFSQPIFAQSSDERYETIGTLNATVDGSELVLITQYDHKKKRSEIKSRESRGVEKTIVITTLREGPVRAAHFPRITFEVWPSEGRDKSARANVTYVGAEGVFQAYESTENQLSLIDFVQTDGTLSFTAAGELAPVVREGAYEIDDTRAPLAFSGSYNATIELR